ncbi:MAG: hypothetical protein HY444_03725 [Nitrospirae bacterium]|nr:hypothetical protein [Nitrospirota bacterium]
MPSRLLTAASLLLIGSALGSVASAPAQEPARTLLVQSVPHARPINLETEISAPMFHGTVHIIDRATLRVTIRTDFGRLVPVAVESCAIIHWLHIGDRVRLDVDTQGIVRALEKTGAYHATVPNAPTPSAWLPGRCPEPST